jgi:hypothetical protein
MFTSADGGVDTAKWPRSLGMTSFAKVILVGSAAS